MPIVNLSRAVEPVVFPSCGIMKHKYTRPRSVHGCRGLLVTTHANLSPGILPVSYARRRAYVTNYCSLLAPARTVARRPLSLCCVRVGSTD